MIAAETVASDPLSALLAYGPLGLMVILFLAGKLRTEAEVKSLEQRLRQKDEVIESKDAQLAKLQESVIERAIPAIVRSTQVLERLAERSS